MKAVGTMSGWIVALALAVVAILRAAREEVAAEPSGEPKAAAAAPAAPPGASKPASWTAPAEAQDAEPCDEGQDAPARVERDGATWCPPGEIDGIEGIGVFLVQATPQERALGERILAACKSGDKQAIVAAAREALNCPEPKVRAMAVEALGRGKDMPQPETSELLLSFSSGGNAYVDEKAFADFTDSLENASDGSAMDADKIIDLSARGLKRLALGGVNESYRMLSAIGHNLSESCMDVDTIQKAAKTFRDLAKSGDEDLANLGRKALCTVAGGCIAYRDEDMEDDAAIDRKLARTCAAIEEAKSVFPDDADKASRYMSYSRSPEDWDAAAKRRFGDDAEAAAAWIAEEKAYLVRRIKGVPPEE